MPIIFLPGWEEILADKAETDLAMSSARLTILLETVPAEGYNSYIVTIGPGLTSFIFPWIPNWFKTSSNCFAFICNSLFVSTIAVDESFTMKRIRARARGRADRYFKRSWKFIDRKRIN